MTSHFLNLVFLVVLLAACSEPKRADMILINGDIHTLDSANTVVQAVAVQGGKFIAVGTNETILKLKGDSTLVIDAKGATVIPGLVDDHLHVIRGGLNYNLELRWDGLTSLKRGLEMIQEQVARTPKGEWVRVVGDWSEFQFDERRLPTLDELNEIASETPVIVLHLYAQAFLNKAAIKALGYTKETLVKDGEIVLDKNGEPTGLLLAKPNALVLYSSISKAPKLSPQDQENSSLHFFREMNRLGVTSVVDAGGGFQNYPEDYTLAKKLAQEGKLTLRIAYYLFAQKPKQELQDYERWTTVVKMGQNDDLMRPSGYVMSGGGENLLWSAADFENFLLPRPDLEKAMEADLKMIIKLLVKNRWAFRIHATYDETIVRFLNVFEEVNKEIPFNGLRWAIDHAETVSDENLKRIKALGGGIALQGRMAYQGEYFVNRYGAEKAKQTPPVKKIIQLGIPVGLGTDGTRVASYHPWTAIYLFTSGKTLGGLELYPSENRLARNEALRLFTNGAAWFSGDDDRKGVIAKGRLADFVILNKNYFTIPEREILQLESRLTVVNGKAVYGAGEYERFSPALPPISPAWSPVIHYGGYQTPMK